MAISLYDVSVMSFLQTLGGVAGFLDRGLAHCRDNSVDQESILQARIFDDMAPFRFQIVAVAHHSRGAIAGAKAGAFGPTDRTSKLDYAGLQALIGDARAELERLTPDEVNTLEGRDVVFQAGDRQVPFTVEGFLLSFSIPNFHFHATTAYDILRSKGVPLGKRDYMGRMRLKA